VLPKNKVDWNRRAMLFFPKVGHNQIGHPQKDLVKFDHKQYHSTWATLA